MEEKQIFETVVCSRCCGTGEYSYCAMYGRVCFKCHGRKKTYTKRGQAVLNWANTQRTKQANAVQAGEYIHLDLLDGIHKFKVQAILKDWEHVKHFNPSTQAWEPVLTCTFITRAGVRYRVGSNCPVRTPWTQELLEQAKAYRDTLTLQGKPREKRG